MAAAVIWALIAVFGGESPELPNSPSQITGDSRANQPSEAIDPLEFGMRHPKKALAECDSAPESAVNTIESKLPPGRTLSTSHTLERDGLIYLAAHVLDEDEVTDHAETWVIEPDTGDVYALSGSANKLTDLPDGRDVFETSAGSDAGLHAQACVYAGDVSPDAPN